MTTKLEPQAPSSSDCAMDAPETISMFSVQSVDPISSEKARFLGSDMDMMDVKDVPKSHSDVKRDAEIAVKDFETLVEGKVEKYRSIVFCNQQLAIAIAGKEGCRLGLTDGSVSLDIAPGSLEDDAMIYLYKGSSGPVLARGPGDCGCASHSESKIYPFSDIVSCGPDGTTFRKDVTLSFEHCATVSEDGSSKLTVFGRDGENDPWEKEDEVDVIVKQTRVEHRFRKFSDRVLAQDGAVGSRESLRMCLIIAVPKDRPLHADIILLRDQRDIIAPYREKLKNRGFKDDEVTSVRGINIDPAQEVLFVGGESGQDRMGCPANLGGMQSFSSIVPLVSRRISKFTIKQPNNSSDNENAEHVTIVIEGGRIRLEGHQHVVNDTEIQLVHTSTEAEQPSLGLNAVNELPSLAAEEYARSNGMVTLNGNVLSQPVNGSASSAPPRQPVAQQPYYGLSGSQDAATHDPSAPALAPVPEREPPHADADDMSGSG